MIPDCGEGQQDGCAHEWAVCFEDWIWIKWLLISRVLSGKLNYILVNQMKNFNYRLTRYRNIQESDDDTTATRREPNRSWRTAPWRAARRARVRWRGFLKRCRWPMTGRATGPGGLRRAPLPRRRKACASESSGASRSRRTVVTAMAAFKASMVDSGTCSHWWVPN